MMNQEKIGKFIGDCRRDVGLTQKELASKLNITTKAVSKWECGRGIPDPGVMQALVNVLGITIDELLNGEKMVGQTIRKSSHNKKKKLTIDNALRKIENNKDLIDDNITLIGDILNNVKLVTISVEVSGFDYVKGNKNAYAILEVNDSSSYMSAIIIDTGDLEFKNILKNLVIGDKFIMAGSVYLNDEVYGDKLMAVRAIRRV